MFHHSSSRTDSARSGCRLLLASFLTAALLAPARPLLAEPAGVTAPQADLTELSLEDLSNLKVQQVYGASKHNQATTEAPSAVSIVTREDIQEFGYRTLTDVLRSVRGFYATYDRKYTFLGADGFNLPGDFGGRTLVMIDGHRINDPLFDSNFAGTEFPLDVDLIDRVEVIRGPGSSLYGNNAFFAVINVITRRSQDLHGAEVSGAISDDEGYKGRFTYGQVFSNGLSLTLSGTFYDSAGPAHLYYPEFDQRITHNPLARNNGFADHLDGEQSKSFFVRLAYGDFSMEGGYSDREKHHPAAAYGTLFDDPHYVLYDERAFLDLKFHREIAADWEFSTRAYFDHYRFDAHSNYPYNYEDPPPPGRSTLNHDLDIARSVGVEAQLSGILWQRQRLTLGSEFRWDPQLEMNNWDNDPAAVWLDISRRAETVGVYLQDEITVCTNLIVNAGVRYDWFSFFGDTVNPRGAVIYSPWSATALKFIYGQAYRAPNVSEWGYVDSSFKANPNLKPETVRSYQMVYEQGWGTRWRSTVSLFLNQVDGLISEVYDSTDNKYFEANINRAESRGVETELEAKWHSGIHARASYTYADARDQAADRRLANSPEHLVKLNLSVPLYQNKIFASVEAQGMSRRLTARGNSTDEFGLVNLTLISRELVKNFEASASVYNVFDTHYGDPITISYAQDTIPQDGRTFRVKLTYRF